MNAATLIKDARTRAGLTQSELAERVGTKQPAIARWESGRADPATGMTDRLLRACGYELSTELQPFDFERDAQIRAQLELTPAERIEQLLNAVKFIGDMRTARRR